MDTVLLVLDAERENQRQWFQYEKESPKIFNQENYILNPASFQTNLGLFSPS